MAPATDAFYQAVIKRELVWDGSPVMRAHIISAVAKQTQLGQVLVKDARHPQLIDAAIAAILAYEAAQDGSAGGGVQHLVSDQELLRRASPGQLDALLALARTGSLKDARAQLGISDPAIKHRLSSLRADNGGATNVQLVYRMARTLDR